MWCFWRELEGEWMSRCGEIEIRDWVVQREQKRGLSVGPVVGRHYHEEYRRGPWYVYAAMIRWWQRELPGCTVNYGGDSGALAYLEEMTEERMRELWDDFCDHGNGDYYGWVSADQ